MIQHIGFIGLGNMGMPMARNLLKAGYALTCFDVRTEQMHKLAQAGAQVAASPADAAREAEVIITMLPASDHVRQAILGNAGVIEGIRPGSTLIEMSTIEPMVTQEIAQELNSHQIKMIDAPVGKSSAAAEDGTLTIMVGGEKEVVDACRPILSKMGTTIYHCGPIGLGETVKIVNNLVSGAIVTVVAEALTIGVKAGADPSIMVDVMNGTGAGNWHLSNTFAKKVFKGDFLPGFKISLMHKDLSIAQSLARSVGVPMFVGSLVRELYMTAMAMGLADDDFGGYTRVFEELVGVEVRSHDDSVSRS